jgi:hypothetical protein
MTTRQAPWTRFAVVVIAMTWSVAVVVALAAQCWLPHPDGDAAHPNHPLAAAVGAEFAVNVDHAHLSHNSTAPCPVEFAIAPLPRSDAAASAHAGVSATTGVAGGPANQAVLAGRGPPLASGLPRSGQDLLTYYCLARR